MTDTETDEAPQRVDRTDPEALEAALVALEEAIPEEDRPRWVVENAASYGWGLPFLLAAVHGLAARRRAAS